jgi:NDP-sugar pyrophosphorylase family protein
MKVLILAAGLGTRLGDLTKNIPKPMIDINGKPFLEYLINLYKKKGVRDFVLCVGYKSEVIIDYFGNGKKFGVNIEYSYGTHPLGTAGEIKNAKRYINERFMFIYGDTYIDFDLDKMLQFHKEHNAKITILCTKSNAENRSGGISIMNNKVTSFEEKVEKNFISAGVFICEQDIKELLEEIPKEELSFEKDIFPELSKKGEVYAYVNDNEFTDIGVPTSLEKFKNMGTNNNL